MNRSSQDWLRWLDEGPGGRWVKRALWLLIVVLTSLTVSYKQFHGPNDERTFAQLVLARSLAEGDGFSSRLHQPQALAMLELREGDYPLDRAAPELYQPPGYATLLAATLRMLPEKTRNYILDTVLPAPDGALADYFVLGLNLALVWATLYLTWRVGQAWFDATVARWAAWGLLVAGPLWAGSVAGTGVALPSLLLAALALVLTHIHRSVESRGTTSGWEAGAAVLAGLLAFVDYSWWPLLPLTAVWLGRREGAGAPRRAWVVFCVVGIVVVTPWILRNLALTGHPLALAGQDWALKAGDPTAEPANWTSRLSSELPPVDWSKIGNKLLTHARELALGEFWAMNWVLGAFALASLLYDFRSAAVRSLRLWVITAFFLIAFSEGVMGVGNEIRPAVIAFAPLTLVLGAGFFGVLVSSHGYWASRVPLAGAALMGLQVLPLLHALAEPRRIHFTYPPYYPALFAAFRQELDSRASGRWLWQCDAPAGAAWYSGRCVWAQPSTAEGFLALGSKQPILAVVLTPRTLDRPFFSELARNDNATTPVSWTWPQVYRGLAQGHLPPAFPLQRIERFAPNLVVLVDGRALHTP